MDVLRNDSNNYLQFFEYKHLPPHLQAISEPFGLLAIDLVGKLPNNHQRDTALQKLIEAKDAAVRSYIFKN